MKSYAQRAHLSLNVATRKLLMLMESKQTNLCFACDELDQNRLFELAELIGPHICILKTHVDILENYSSSFGQRLREIAEKHHFLIFEDRKFADIGSTVKKQYEKGIYKIVEWADFINLHPIVGPLSIEALRQVGLEKERGLFLLAEMSSKGNLITEKYVEHALKMAEEYQDFVTGFISQSRIHSLFVHLTPGVWFEKQKDHLGQQYRDPSLAIATGSDILIVGRGILESTDPLLSAIAYRQAGWKAYQKLIQ